MQLPAYILTSGNTAAVDLRPLYERMGLSSRHFAEWFRTYESRLKPGTDYAPYYQGRHFHCMASLPATFALLNAVTIIRNPGIWPELKAVEAQLIAQGFQLEGVDLAGLSRARKADFSPTLAPDSGSSDNVPSNEEDPAQSPDSAGKVITSGPLPIYVIGGRAAVKAEDLYARLSRPGANDVLHWTSYRIKQLGLIKGKHFLDYKEGRHVHYLLSLEAAIEITRFKPKARAKEIESYLSDFKRFLKAQKLPATAKLSDFLHLKPGEVVTGQPEVTQATLFDQQPPLIRPEAPQTALASPSPAETTPETENSPAEPSSIAAEEDSQPEKKTPTAAELLVQMAQMVLQSAQLLADLERRQQFTETTTRQMVAIGQQAALQTLGLHKGDAQPPANTLRDQIRHRVNQRARATRETHEDIFKEIYSQLFYTYGISISDHTRLKDETHLGCCERLGFLDKAWAIVDSKAFNAYREKLAPMQEGGPVNG
ncbi:hypothetical protein [Larkinella soli]|uniref:hypothetical protein n=1 Tax=Larkinella soli TaxID=1770527 RepID=UPI000FFB6137|nr:hypothetical protein [Larkinella soli]